MQGYQDFHMFQFQNAANSNCDLQHLKNQNGYKIASQKMRLPIGKRINIKSRETQFFAIIFVYLGAICLHGCQ